MTPCATHGASPPAAATPPDPPAPPPRAGGEQSGQAVNRKGEKMRKSRNDKTFAIKGDPIHGTIGMKLVRQGTAVAVYWPAGMDMAPSVLTGDLRAKCDAIKAKYGLVERA